MVRLCLMLFLFAMPTAFGGDLDGDLTKEPEQAMTLFLDGNPFVIKWGTPKKLSGTFANPTVRVEAATTRRFSYGGITFDYPSYFSWEADVEDPMALTWTLNGKNSVVTYMIFDAAVTLDSVIEILVSSLGKDNTQLSPVSYTLGGSKYEGKRLLFNVAETSVTQDILSIPSLAGKTCILILQDVDPKADKGNPEAPVIYDMLTKTFAIIK